MNLFQVSILGASLATVVMGGVVFLTQRHRRVNQMCLVLALGLTAWLAFLGMASLSRSVDEAMFWIRQTSLAAGLVPVLVYLLRMAMIENHLPVSRMMRHAAFWMIPYLLVAVLCQTGFFLESATLPSDGENIPQPVYGPGFAVFLLYIIFAWALLVRLFVRDLRQVRGVQKAELQFLSLGCLSGLLTGIILVILPQWTGYTEVAQLMPLAAIVFIGSLAYGVATRSILDVPSVIRRVIATSLLVLYLAVLYFVVWSVLDYLLATVNSGYAPIAHFLAALMVAFAMSPAQGRLQRMANRLFVKSPPIDTGAVIQETTRILNAIGRVDDLYEQFALLVHQKLQVEHVRVFMLVDETWTQTYTSPNDLSVLSLHGESDLIGALDQEPDPVVCDFIQRVRPTPVLSGAEAEMRQHGVAAAVAIRAKGKMIGCMLLGPRQAARMYGIVEQQLLSGLCDQLAISLENATLYTEIQDSRIYNSTLLENLVSGVIAANDQGTITVCNREASRIIGLAPSYLTGQSIESLPQPLFALLEKVLRTRREVRDQKLTLALDGREEFVLNAGCARVNSHIGQSMGALLVFNDNTRVSKLEQQVRRTDRLASLGTLSAGMAHEIKNPLVTLKTFAQLLPDRYDDEDFRETFSGLVGSEINRIDGIVNQLLDFARPAKPTLAPIELHAVVDQTVKLLKQQFKQTGIQIVVDDQASTDRILGDSNLLAQALLNFFLNAMDAMEMGGVLTVQTSIVEPSSQATLTWQNERVVAYLCLSIRDSGQGIAPEDLNHVFDPFFTTKSSGTGLGLSVSHGIVQEHGGMVDVESELGVGTVFRMYFPMLEETVVI